MSAKFRNNNAGFTLVETLIYIAIVGLVSVTLVRFSLVISQSSNTSTSTQEVHESMREVLQIVRQKVHMAESVYTASSTFGADPGVLYLEMSDAAKDPTIFDLSADDGVLRMTEGAASPIQLTGNKLKVENLVFTDVTGGSQKESIRMALTMSYRGNGDAAFRYEKSVTTTIRIRH